MEDLLVGGVTMLAHVGGRNTEEVDLIVSLSDQSRIEPVKVQQAFRFSRGRPSASSRWIAGKLNIRSSLASSGIIPRRARLIFFNRDERSVAQHRRA